MQKLVNRQIGPHCILACLYFLLLPTTIAVNSAGNSILKLATIPIGLFFLVTLILSNRKLQINGVHLALLIAIEYLKILASLQFPFDLCSFFPKKALAIHTRKFCQWGKITFVPLTS